MKKEFESTIQKLHLKREEIVKLLKETPNENSRKFNNALIFINNLESDVKSFITDFDFGDITANFKLLINNWIQKVDSLNLNSDIDLFHHSLSEITNEFKILRVFSFISTIDSTVVLVGANGSGKSTLINHLRTINNNQMFAFPAQKFLYFDKGTFHRNDVTIDSYRDSFRKSIFKFDGIEFGLNKKDDIFIDPFSNLITLLVKDYSAIATNKQQGIDEDKKPLWDKFVSIWNQLIPEIRFRLDSDDRLVFVKKMSKSTR